MGYWSDQAIRETETGINREAIKDRRVCQTCFDDRHIREVIIRESDTQRCDYCGSEGETVAAAPLDIIVEFILAQLEHEYAPADQTLPRDPETKERMFPEDEFDTRTMLELYVGLSLPDD
ncbi:HEPN-associated N-terminal domain-containing protein, partial [Citromicrobium bathyomarinum]|uniref:HEPN-associated N-terminal domain-containing protein n=1 Tax=Citromicrobium bathyomarinum TaxID=72174 RepID=UPI00315A561D